MVNAEKTLLSEDFPCPHCGQMIHVEKTRKTIVPSEKAQYDEKFSFRKADQKTLEGTSQ